MKKRLLAALAAASVAAAGVSAAVIPAAISNAAVACQAPYANEAVYTAGAQVSYQGKNWAAKWWTQHEAPSTGGSGVWQDKGACGSGGSGGGSQTPATPTAGTRIFADQFDSFNTSAWQCEYTCPSTDNSRARFNLRTGIPANKAGSWTKARYKPSRFTSGKFTVRFALTARPAQKVWWGVALWDDGPAADGSQFNEINFGYTTNQSFTNTQLLFESAKRGKFASIKVDTGVDLYDEQWHTATLEYNAQRVSFTLDGRLLKTITDQSVIPTDAMDFLLGPRLVPGGEPLTRPFTQSIDWVEIYR